MTICGSFFLIPLPILNSDRKLLPSCKKKKYFDSNKKLPKAEMQDEEQQLIASSKKELNGTSNTMIAEMLSITIGKSVTYKKNNS
jgi:hypothetical protein